VKQADISEIASALGIPLDSAQIRRLIDFEALLRERAIPSGMVAASDASRLRERHILDSLRAAAPTVLGQGAPNGREAASMADLGSGAGLPGIVLAIALPDSHMTLVEQRPKRAAFLELSVRELPLDNVTVFTGSAESLAAAREGEGFHVALARAFKPLGPAWDVAAPLLAADGCLIYFAGAAAAIGEDFPKKHVKVSVEACPLLESSGPLVIMARK